MALIVAYMKLFLLVSKILLSFYQE